MPEAQTALAVQAQNLLHSSQQIGTDRLLQIKIATDQLPQINCRKVEQNVRIDRED